MTAALEKKYAPIDLGGFDVAIEHYQPATTGTHYSRLRPEQIVANAENLIRYQRADGGWQTEDFRLTDETRAV